MKKFILLLMVFLLMFTLAFGANIDKNGYHKGDIVKLLTNMKDAILNVALNDAGVAATQAIGISINVQYPVTFSIQGKLYSMEKDSAYTIDSPDIDLPTQNVSSSVYYLFSVNSAGTITVDAGRVDRYEYPRLPENHAPIAGIQVTTDHTATFRWGKSFAIAESVSTNIEKIRVLTSGPSKVSLKKL